ncbi:MAG: hypothetical protein RBT37_04715 [Dissulfurispiraceae bacterium]|jgi:hypothetical protein|nr:hypothetical protein [Dissulfurispiraceae bacterium]
MFKFLRRLGCLTVIIIFIFLFIAFTSGGDNLRWAGNKVGGVLQNVINSLADKADELKGKRDSSFGKVKELGEKGKRE